MKNGQNLFFSIGIWLLITFSGATFITPMVQATQTAIIYEYKTITQKKGQSLIVALASAKLTEAQQNTIMTGDFVKSAKSQRQFILYFNRLGAKKLLRGVTLLLGNKEIASYTVGSIESTLTLINLKNIAISERQQYQKRFKNAIVQEISHKTVVTEKEKIPQKQDISEKPALKNPNNTNSGKKVTAKATKKLISQRTIRPIQQSTPDLKGLSINQNEGQSLIVALAPAKLTEAQQNTIMTGDFVKSAKSQRQFILYFNRLGDKKLLRGVTFLLGNEEIASYTVGSIESTLTLINLKNIAISERQQYQKRFKNAIVQEISHETVVTKKDPSPAKIKIELPPEKKVIQLNNQYISLSFTQKQGQSLNVVMQNTALTKIQQKLISQMPEVLSAKITHHIYLLFERKNDVKYLKAMKIMHDNKIAEYVLVKYQGQWTWANEKGEIETTDSEDFARYPLKFARITSGFNPRRYHPITHRIHPHLGVDLGAPYGTPIDAPANGVVVFSGQQHGFGITLEIDHQNGYHTKYGHLSQIMPNAQKGMLVKKGQLIAKVGNTGLSTGPHLHYEVIVNGQHYDPVTVKLPGDNTITIVTLDEAKTVANQLLPILHKLSP
ncbi:MAG: M23 family metallopeptidase [Ostreibacterium sp.]